MPRSHPPNVTGNSIILIGFSRGEREIFNGAFLEPFAWHRKEKTKTPDRVWVAIHKFIAANKYYTTAPTKYTSDVQGLGTIFSETIEENIDTITTATALTFSLNLALYIQYTLTPKIDVGCNIDVLDLVSVLQNHLMLFQVYTMPGRNLFSVPRPLLLIYFLPVTMILVR